VSNSYSLMSILAYNTISSRLDCINENMNFRDLEYIIAVSEEKSFNRAAGRCFVSQPALSMQIKKLEQTLGVPIFERNQKKMLVTPVGQKIIQKASEILQTKKDIQSIAEHAKDHHTATFRLGVFPTLAQYILPNIISMLQKQFPNIRFYPIEEKSETLIAMIQTGALDAALLAAPVLEEHLYFEPLFKDSFLLAVYQDHPLAKKETIPLQALPSEEMLILAKGHCLRDQIETLGFKHTHQNVADYEATSLETLRQMVAAKIGITVIPEIATIQSHLQHHVYYKPFTKPEPYRTIGLVTRKSYPDNKFLPAFAKLIQKSHQDLINSPH